MKIPPEFVTETTLGEILNRQFEDRANASDLPRVVSLTKSITKAGSGEDTLESFMGILDTIGEHYDLETIAAFHCMFIQGISLGVQLAEAYSETMELQKLANL